MKWCDTTSNSNDNEPSLKFCSELSLKSFRPTIMSIMVGFLTYKIIHSNLKISAISRKLIHCIPGKCKTKSHRRMASSWSLTTIRTILLWRFPLIWRLKTNNWLKTKLTTTWLDLNHKKAWSPQMEESVSVSTSNSSVRTRLQSFLIQWENQTQTQKKRKPTIGKKCSKDDKWLKFIPSKPGLGSLALPEWYFFMTLHL